MLYILRMTSNFYANALSDYVCPTAAHLCIQLLQHSAHYPLLIVMDRGTSTSSDGMKLLLLLLVFLCLGAVYAKPVAEGSLVLRVRTPSRLEGTFTIRGTDLSFIAQPSALNLVKINGPSVLAFVDYGAFARVHLPDAVFLIAASDLALPHSVIDITSSHVTLPNINTSVSHGLDENLKLFETLVAGVSSQGLAAAEHRVLSLMKAFTQSEEAEALPHLSAKLALEDITGVAYPSSLVIHMPALRVAKIRQAVTIDPELVAVLNARYNNVSTSTPEDGCSISDICDNACFGMCGNKCTCWKWVCGDCDCHIGCRQHDCCCSCEGFWTLCCLNVVAVKCDGYDNPCKIPL
jgi:hypothetical protein